MGKVILDIAHNLTDKQRNPSLYMSYTNARHFENNAEFVYEFVFGSSRVRYEYGKPSYEDILEEKFYVDEVLAVSRDRNDFQSDLPGAETLNNDNKLDIKISAMRFSPTIRQTRLSKTSSASWIECLCFPIFVKITTRVLPLAVRRWIWKS